jgi:hypothetical protein
MTRPVCLAAATLRRVRPPVKSSVRAGRSRPARGARVSALTRARTRDPPAWEKRGVRRPPSPTGPSYRAGLRSAVQGAALPYGYTVTMWSSGQVLIHFHGVPSLALVALFAAGALAGYGVLQAVAGGRDAAPGVGLGGGPSWIRGGGIQLGAVGLTLAAVAAAGALLTPALSWALGGMATVVGYLGIVALECALQAAQRPGEE